MKLLKVIVIIIIFFAGILSGYFFKNFPFVAWNREIKIYEVFQILSTLFIGLAIPFLIKKWIDDSRNMKTLLVEEGKEVLLESKNIKEKLFDFYNNHTISEDDKQLLLLLFSQLENSITQFKKSLEHSFGDKNDSQFHDLKIAYYEYEKNVTGGQLMTEGFVIIDLDFLNFFTIEFNKFQNSIRVFLIGLQKI